MMSAAWSTCSAAFSSTYGQRAVPQLPVSPWRRRSRGSRDRGPIIRAQMMSLRMQVAAFTQIEKMLKTNTKSSTARWSSRAVKVGQRRARSLRKGRGNCT